MTQPLALVLYERVLPGSRLVNRLEELSYRVKSISDRAQLAAAAEAAKPMLVFADLQPGGKEVCQAIARLKQDPKTSYLPVVAFGAETVEVENAAREAGVTLVVAEAALLTHLPQFLEQALQVD